MADRGAGRVAVVNGAGPSGLTAAACLAARGFSVQVFERGELDALQSNARSACFNLSKRTYEAVRACGMDSAPLSQNELRELRVHVLKGDPIKIPVPPQTYALAERHETVTHLLAELQRLYGKRVQVHKHHKLVAIDIGAQQLTYCHQEEQINVKYDLLVGADGVNSFVRQALTQQVAGFSVESDGKYEAHCKTVLPSTYKQQRLPDAKSSIHLYELNDSTSKRTPLQYSGAMWVTDHRPGHSPIEGHLFLHVDALPKYKTKANFQQLLSSCQLHEDATDAIAEQAVGLEKWHTSVSRLKCSQLHGPHVVLVGEAAHSVTSHDGQGCNAAMESVEVLGQVLDKVGNLDDVPAAFTSARISEAHALVDLDRVALSEFGFAGPWQWAFIRQMNNVVLWGALHALVPFLVGPPAMPITLDAHGRLLGYAAILKQGNQRAFVTLLSAAGLLASIAYSVL